MLHVTAACFQWTSRWLQAVTHTITHASSAHTANRSSLSPTGQWATALSSARRTTSSCSNVRVFFHILNCSYCLNINWGFRFGPAALKRIGALLFCEIFRSRNALLASITSSCADLNFFMFCCLAQRVAASITLAARALPRQVGCLRCSCSLHWHTALPTTAMLMLAVPFECD